MLVSEWPMRAGLQLLVLLLLSVALLFLKYIIYIKGHFQKLVYMYIQMMIFETHTNHNLD